MRNEESNGRQQEAADRYREFRDNKDSPAAAVQKVPQDRPPFQARISIITGITAALAAAAGAFIYYCEKLQLLPLTMKGLIGRLIIAATCGFVLFGLLSLLLRKAIQTITKREWLPLLIVSLITSVCVMVWFPIPRTGLFSEHRLSVRAIPDESGLLRPITLTWVNRESGDVSLSQIRCTGNCAAGEKAITLRDGTAEISWQGLTGKTVTLEFHSGEDQGIAEISWDGIKSIKALSNPAYDRLSYDFSFPPSAGLPEFIAVWWLAFLLCLSGFIGLIKMLSAWNIRKFAFGIFAVFAAFRIIQFLSVSGPLSFVDSEFYLGLSRFSIGEILSGKEYCRTEWHCVARPVLTPLVYKLCRQDIQTITIVQLTVSILSWGYFMLQAATLCRTDIRKKAVMILTLGLGCIPNVTRWDTMIMSESLSISTGLLFLGSLFLLTQAAQKKWKTAPAVCTGLTALLFSVSRDSAVWSVIPVIVILPIIARARERKRIPLILSGALAVIAVFLLIRTGNRWVYSFENVLFTRILRDPQGEALLREAGMPFPDGIEELYGTEHLMTNTLFNSEAYAPLRDWIHENGLKTYIGYMLRNPFETLSMTWHEGFESYAFEKINYTFTPFGFKQLLPDPVVKFFSCNLPGVLIIGLGLAGIFCGFLRQGGERYPFPVLFILSAYLLCTAAFIADSYELDRHMMTTIIMLKASCWPLMSMLSEDIRKKL